MENVRSVANWNESDPFLLPCTSTAISWSSWRIHHLYSTKQWPMTKRPITFSLAIFGSSWRYWVFYLSTQCSSLVDIFDAEQLLLAWQHELPFNTIRLCSIEITDNTHTIYGAIYGMILIVKRYSKGPYNFHTFMYLAALEWSMAWLAQKSDQIHLELELRHEGKKHFK